MEKHEQDNTSERPLIIYKDDDGTEKVVHSYFEISDGVISFKTAENKIILPLSRLIKIKEKGGRYD